MPVRSGDASVNSTQSSRLLHQDTQHNPFPPLGVDNARQRILFLGNSYSDFSLTCFQALLDLGHDVILGLHDPLKSGLWKVSKQRLRTLGWSLLLQKGADLIQAKSRIALRRAGIRLSKFATLGELCSANEINVISCHNPNSPEFVERVRVLGVDLIVVGNFNRILKSTLLDTPRLGGVNVHLSLLPKYRGPSPLYWALANREEYTGVTIHHIDEGIDSGDIIGQRKIEIRQGETLDTLSEKSGQVAAELLREIIPLLLKGKASRVPQNHASATYYSWPPKWSVRSYGRRLFRSFRPGAIRDAPLD
jgi:methionyl-tRNA formyltransferase